MSIDMYNSNVHMNSISFTQLRTQSTHLKQALEAGQTVKLVHRSRVLAEIKPQKPAPKVFDAKKMRKIVKALNLPKLSVAQMEANYRQHIEQKYGKYLSGHK